MAHVETVTSPEKIFEKNVHNPIMDTAIETTYRRYQSHGTLYCDLDLLDPRNLSQVKSSPLPQSAFQELSKCLLKFTTNSTEQNMN